jgi:L-aminopeptidase/D-esterase-like protein
MSGSLTDVAGVAVGHWSDPVAMTGCTVVVLPEPNVVSVEARGAAPGSREMALLGPGMRVQQAHAILLTGGSAFGLAAADGVMRELESEGRGQQTPAGPVPIVPAAVIFDLMVGDGSVRPGPDEGAAAMRAASYDPVPSGLVGAGAGATAAKWRGAEARVPAGLGSASVERYGVTVGALVVLNAVGDVFSLEGRPLTGGPHVPGPPAVIPGAMQNTTLAVVATDAAFTRDQASRLAVRAQDAYSACIRPAHTGFDGDICFAVSCGRMEGAPDLVAEMAFEATGRAIEAAARSSVA